MQQDRHVSGEINERLRQAADQEVPRQPHHAEGEPHDGRQDDACDGDKQRVGKTDHGSAKVGLCRRVGYKRLEGNVITRRRTKEAEAELFSHSLEICQHIQADIGNQGTKPENRHDLEKYRSDFLVVEEPAELGTVLRRRCGHLIHDVSTHVRLSGWRCRKEIATAGQPRSD